MSAGNTGVNANHPVFLLSADDPDLAVLRTWTQAGAPPIRRPSVLDAAVFAEDEPPPYIATPVDAAVLERFEPAQEWLLGRCAAGTCHQWTGGRLLLLKGSAAEREQLRRNYLTVRELVEPGAPPQFSQLLRKILAAPAGGAAHAGGPMFFSLDELAEEPIWDWVAQEAGEREDRALSPAENMFVDEVQPILVRQGCLFENCHGPNVPNLLRFEPGVGGDFSDRELRQNYRTVQGQLAHAASPLASRLVRKPLEVAAGGMRHVTRAVFASTEADDLETILEWATLEAEARAEAADAPIGRIEGIVYVELPSAARSETEPTAWSPGGDVMLQPASLEADGALELTGEPGKPDRSSPPRRSRGRARASGATRRRSRGHRAPPRGSRGLRHLGGFAGRRSATPGHPRRGAERRRMLGAQPRPDVCARRPYRVRFVPQLPGHDSRPTGHPAVQGRPGGRHHPAAHLDARRRRQPRRPNARLDRHLRAPVPPPIAAPCSRSTSAAPPSTRITWATVWTEGT